jgi:ABC-type transport system involved in multi-copper enzyme maturation permease subunit
MLNILILNDIRQNILSLKLQVMFVIMLVVFIVGSVAFIYLNKAAEEDYRIYANKSRDEMMKQAETNVTEVAVLTRDYIFKPIQNGFIEDAKLQYLPNTINYNAYNVFGYSISRRTGNPYLSLSQELNWSFIITIILSFAILLLSFDTISGERETHTLSLLLSNSVSRTTLLLGKYISIIATGFIMVLPGFIISLLIFMVSRRIIIDVPLLTEIIMFISVQILFIASIAALGLFCSVISRTSNVSLLVSLTLWSVFLIFSPNLAVFSAENLFRIKNSETIQAEIESAKEAINKAAPEGSWSMSGNDPFYPKHELRARNQTNLLNAEKQIRDAWYNEQFLQYKRASYFSNLSPISLFGKISESVTGVGFNRFMKNWDDLHLFQPQFLAWFKGIDRKDTRSPHWYNPYEVCSTSRESVKYEEIPQYQERSMTVSQRLSGALPGILLLMLYSIVLFGATVMLFNRYDVR